MKLEEVIKKVNEKWIAEPKLKQERDEVLAKYSEVFKLENIDNLTNETFREFLNYKYNKHWNGLNQTGGHLVKDMDKLKSALKILLDESQSLSNRIKRLRDRKSEDYVSNFGRAIYTIILLVTNPKKYPVVNNPVLAALDKFDLYSKKLQKSKKEWIYVPEVQKIIQDIASKNDLDLWKIDWVWKGDKEWLNGEGVAPSEEPIVDEAGFMNFSPQLGSWISEKYVCLIKKFKKLDGQPIDLENRRKFLQMLFDCDIITPETGQSAKQLAEATVDRKYNSYQTLVPAYGFGRIDEQRFELNGIGKYCIKKNDIGFFITHQMLKFQYPNGTFGTKKDRGTGFEIRPFVFFLKILCTLHENKQKAHLSKVEINLIRKHVNHHDDEIQSAYEQIIGNRKNNTASTEINSDCEKTITRFFPTFGATELINHHKGSSEQIISMSKEQFVKARVVLDVLEDSGSLEYKQYENKNEWLTYYGKLDLKIIEALKLAEYKSILENSKHQIIFYGPPGTGKTYVAKKLAKLITNTPINETWSLTDYRKLVQFHPSYS